MIDPKLNFRLESCQKLLTLWQQFHAFIRAMEKGGIPTAQDEADFLRLKSEIAIVHDAFFDSIPERGREETATAQAIIGVVERCIMLRTVKRMTAAEIKRMEIEWHEAYLLINDTIGVLQDDVDKISKISPLRHAAKVYADKSIFWFRHSVGDPKMQFAFGALAVIALLVIGPAMGFWSYDILNQYPATKKGYQIARTVVRSSVYGGLAYQEWEQYEKGRDPIASMPQGYNRVAAFPPDEERGARESFAYKKYSNVEPFDFRSQVAANSSGAGRNTVIYKYQKGSGPIYVFITMFEANGKAQEMVDAWKKWFDNLPTGSEALEKEANYSYARHNNVVFGVFAANPEERNAVMEIALLKTRKEK